MYVLNFLDVAFPIILQGYLDTKEQKTAKQGVMAYLRAVGEFPNDLKISITTYLRRQLLKG